MEEKVETAVHIYLKVLSLEMYLGLLDGNVLDVVAAVP